MTNVNVIAYDVKRKIDKNKTWIGHEKNIILSREIPYYKYYTLSVKYNPNIKDYDYYILFFNTKVPNIISYKTIKDDYGRIKIRLNGDFNRILSIIEHDINVEIECVEKYEDSAVYKLKI